MIINQILFQNIQQLLNFRDPDKVISNFLTKFRNEFLNTIPENLDGSIDKRKLIKNIKSVYRAKGTSRGHEMFFRMLFGHRLKQFILEKICCVYQMVNGQQIKF